MSNTIRKNDLNQRAARDDKQKKPTPYPPVEPTVAQKKSEQKDR